MENETKADLSDEEKKFLFTSMFKKIDQNIAAKEENCSVIETENDESFKEIVTQEGDKCPSVG